jgi:thymidylate kinase
VAAAYAELAREEPERIRVIDAAGAETEVLAAALAALEDLVR